MKKFLFITSMGDEVSLTQDALIIHFNDKRSVVSSSNHNGGYRDDLEYIFNHSCVREIEETNKLVMKGPDMETHFCALAEELELPVYHTTGLSTAARMKNRAVITLSHDSLEVTSIVTAGIDYNAGRAGDPAGFDEVVETMKTPPAGTINIILLINANLDPGALVRAMVTATEAKTAALQELLANSMYSEDLATGSGTDGVIVVGNPASELKLYITGKHSILGELIGRSVKMAVKEALHRQSGMDIVRQASVEWQNKRYGITALKINECYRQLYPDHPKTDKALEKQIHLMMNNNKIVAQVASVIHLIDQNRWGLIYDSTLSDTGWSLLTGIRQGFQLSPMYVKPPAISKEKTNQPVYKELLSDLIYTLAEIVFVFYKNKGRTSLAQINAYI